MDRFVQKYVSSCIGCCTTCLPKSWHNAVRNDDHQSTTRHWTGGPLAIVPNRFKLDDLNLGRWVSSQRRAKDKMSPERRQRLDDIGFVWDILAEAWEEGFSKLLQFKQAKGHCIVPSRFKLDDFNLGIWVSNQRKAKDRLSPERRKRLDNIGFVWNARDKT